MSDRVPNNKLPNSMLYKYSIRFKKSKKTYSLDHFNSPHDSVDKALEDIRIMMEGKDLKGVLLPAYKVVDWEELEEGTYDLEVDARFYRKKQTEPFEQYFRVQKLQKAE